MSAVTWSTAAVPRSRQFGYWREMICEAFLDLSPDAARGAARDGFRGRVTQRRLGRLAIAQIGSQAQRVRRTEAGIARSPRAGYYANLQLRGSCRTVQDGRAAVTRPGDLTVVDTERPFTFELSDDFAQLSFYVPGQLLHPQLEQPVVTATRIPTVSGVGAALRHTLQALEDDVPAAGRRQPPGGARGRPARGGPERPGLARPTPGRAPGAGAASWTPRSPTSPSTWPTTTCARPPPPPGWASRSASCTRSSPGTSGRSAPSCGGSGWSRPAATWPTRPGPGCASSTSRPTRGSPT